MNGPRMPTANESTADMLTILERISATMYLQATHPCLLRRDLQLPRRQDRHCGVALAARRELGQRCEHLLLIEISD
jgi:hypothetical protein